MRVRLEFGLCAVLAIAGASFSGCGGGGDNLPREPVSGKVTLDGAPLASGDITFMPIDAASTSTAVAAKVLNGAYEVRRSDGPVPGPYRVTISSVEEQAPADAAKAKPGDGDAPIMKERVPAAYNAKTTLKADVEKGGKNEFDFPLTSK
jgi:hypothetical protein